MSGITVDNKCESMCTARVVIFLIFPLPPPQAQKHKIYMAGEVLLGCLNSSGKRMGVRRTGLRFNWYQNKGVIK